MQGLHEKTIDFTAFTPDKHGVALKAAIYLSEYARPGPLLRAIRVAINNLAGVPSVVFGLFGLGFFVIYLKLGVSLFSGALTLGVMSLPVIIGAGEEALRAVPDAYREASYSLGATRIQTIVRVVLPAALSGILYRSFRLRLSSSLTTCSRPPGCRTGPHFFTWAA